MNINVIINETDTTKLFLKQNNIEIKSLNYLLKHSDIITLHINYEEKNKNFVDSNFLNKMRK